MRLEPGESVGSYRIVRRLGQGGMGVVYEAHDAVHNRSVALKMMAASVVSEQGARARFLREARAVASLRHRNIVAVLDLAEEGDVPYLIMELLDGTSLAERLASGPPLSRDASLDIVIQLCEGLQYAHEKGIVHRDVKPANIRLLRDGGVKLLDFGIASISGATVTRPGSVVGSAAYMAPEQIAGVTVDGRADIFSSGVVLYELLAGRRPFETDTVTGVMLKILHDPAPPLAMVASHVPEGLVVAVETALQKDPANRYAHIADFGADLRLVRYESQTWSEPVSTAPANVPATAGPVRRPAAAPVVEAPPSDAGPESVTLDLPERSNDVAARPPMGPVTGFWSAMVRRGSRRWLVGLGLAAAAVVVALTWPAVTQDGPGGMYELDIESVPAGAVIAIDAKPTGRTSPAKITSASRPERVQLSLAGYAPIDEALTGLSAGRSSTLRFSLSRLVHVGSDPPGATILVDGKDTGRRTPSDVPVPPGGTTKLELQLAGYVQKEITADMIASGNVKILLPRLSRTIGAPAASARVTLQVSGEYDFTLGGECVRAGSGASREHTIVVMAPCSLRLSAPRYRLDSNVRVEPSPATQKVSAPPPISVDLRTKFDGCTVILNGSPVGPAPARVKIAQGSYTVQVQCPGRPILSSAHGALQLKPGWEASIQNGYYVFNLDKILNNR